MIELAREQGRINIELKAIPMGEDLAVVITGGHCPHLGAVALGVARPSLADSQKLSASTSVLAMVGHKEDETARKVAHTLASRLGKNVVVSCGIHVDEITADEISIVSGLLEQLTKDLLNRLKQS
jgi:hypothetical protein